jgi:uncharacterized protein involved in exopolysaccharide biosynthesis
MKSRVRNSFQTASGAPGDSVEPPTGEAAPPTPRFLLAQAILFLRRNLVRIGAISVLVAALAFGASLLFLAKYSATAVIVVDARATKAAQAGAGALPNISLDNSSVESLAVIAKSEQFLGELVDKLDLVHDPDFAGRGRTEQEARAATVEKLGARLYVARRGTTYVLEATAVSPSPEKSATIANAVAQMIVDDQSNVRSNADEKIAANIEGRLGDLRERVSRAEQAAAELKAKLKVTDTGQGATLLQRRVYELNQQLVAATSRTAEARARFEQLRRAGAHVGDNLSPSVQTNVLTTLRSEYARLTRQAADQATVLGARHPEVASLHAQIADLKRQMGAEIGRMLATARTEFMEAEQREASLSRQLKAAQEESGTLAPELVRLGELDHEAAAERSLYEQLLARQKELAESKGLEPNDVRIVSRAIPPIKTTPTKLILALASCGAGLLAALCYALGRELMRPTFKTPQQAESVAGAPVSGLVPFTQPGPSDEAGKPQTLDLSPWLEDLSASLHSGARAGGQAVLVTSARRGEGRSTIAAGVASNLGRGGLRVLLLEADRAKSKGASKRLGLLDVLARGEDIQSAFVERETGRYTLLPFGGRTVDGRMSIGSLMNGLTLRAALKLCRDWFDVIVIDGPPVLESNYARFLSQQADAIVFVVEWDKTNRDGVIEALDRLGDAEATLVFNKVDLSRLRLFDPERARQLVALAEGLNHPIAQGLDREASRKERLDANVGPRQERA